MSRQSQGWKREPEASSRQRRRVAFRPDVHGLESRALLSGLGGIGREDAGVAPIVGSVQAAASASQRSGAAVFVDGLYERMFDRDPSPRELRAWFGPLQSGRSTKAAVAREFLTSAEYRRDHASSSAFVEGLYEDVLDKEAPAGEAEYWTGVLDRRRVSRTQLAQIFLARPDSFLRTGSNPVVNGQVTAVTVQPGATSSISGNLARVGIVHNRNDFAVRTITLSVNARGNYTLDQSQSWGTINNTGSRWRSFKLTILKASSTAQPTLVDSSELAGLFTNRTITTDPAGNTVVTFSGGPGVPTGPSSRLQLYSQLKTAQGGTIVILEQPFS